MYKLTTSVNVFRILDAVFIPADPANTDYAAYLVWISEGNTPTPADPVPGPTYQELRAAAYPPIGDQLDALWKSLASSGLVLGTDGESMLNAIKEVKISHPKNG